MSTKSALNIIWAIVLLALVGLGLYFVLSAKKVAVEKPAGHAADTSASALNARLQLQAAGDDGEER